MRLIARRLQRLERGASSQRNEAGEKPADVLRERIRLIAEAGGRSYEALPRGRLTNDRGKALSVAEILRGR